MARWTASAKWAEGPALDDQRAMPLALRLSEGLGSNFAKPTRWNFIKCGQYCWYGASQVFSSIAPRSNHKNRDWQRILVLLILHTLVSRKQEIKLILCECK